MSIDTLALEFELDWDHSKNGRWIKAGPFVIEVFKDSYAIDIKIPGLGLISVGDRKTEAGAKSLCKQIANSIFTECWFTME